MEEAQTLFREGVLHHLDQLETLARNLAVKQEQKQIQRDEQEERRKMVLKLRKERDELRTKIKLQKEELRAFTAMGDTPPDPGHSSVRTQEMLLEMRLEQLKGILEMYWLTGISGKRTKKGASICINTAFEGTYLDCFSLDLVLKPSLAIARNSIPPFIPMERIAKAHLQTDLKKFLSVLFEHLNAYCGRKYQFEQVQLLPKTFLTSARQMNALYTVLSLDYNVKIETCTVCFSAQLLYSDITRCLPTEATITCNDSQPSLQDKISSQSTLFREKPLHKALESLRSEEDTLKHTSIAALLETDF
ncbi:centromere protein O [Rhinophrynus dorsalis]